MVNIQKKNSYLYMIEDLSLKGYITWSEKRGGVEVIAVLMFTTGEKAEEYIYKVLPRRGYEGKVGVCRVSNAMIKPWIKQMRDADIDYALIDVPPIAADQFSEGYIRAEEELVRDYAIVDLDTLSKRYL